MLKRAFRSLVLTSLVTVGPMARAETVDFSVTARLTHPDGRPVAGPVALEVAFYHQESDGTPVLTVTDGLADVELQEGILQVTLPLDAADYARVFSSVSQ